MSGENNGVSNANDQVASGTDQATERPIQDVVSHETFKKLLGQKKTVEQENADLKKRLQSIEEQKLQEAGEWKKIAELKEKETLEAKQLAETEKQRADSLNKNLLNMAKLQAVTEALPGKLELPEYMAFIPLDKVIINPETGEIDKTSVESVSQEFVKKYSKLLKADPKFLPNGNPSPASQLTHEEWLKLPVDQKRLRMKDVKK